jgi:hypothetical protein
MRPLAGRLGRVVGVIVLIAVTVSAVALVVPAAAIGPVRPCAWSPALLPLPANTVDGKVTAGGGEWLAGVAGSGEPGDPDQGVLWRRGWTVALGVAFGQDTYLQAVNPSGVAVGNVTGADNQLHAIRHRDGRYEYLPVSGESSNAVDINPRGDVVGYDGPATLVVWTGGGAVRTLDLPAGEHPYGWPAIDDDGTVVAWTGRIDAGGTFHRSGYVWTPAGVRVPLPPPVAGDDVTAQDVRDGRIVGTAGPAGVPAVAVGWQLDGSRARRVRLHPGEAAVAVNRVGQVAGDQPAVVLADVGGPIPLALSVGRRPGVVAAVNDREIGGYTFPADDADDAEGYGTVPVRWRCR